MEEVGGDFIEILVDRLGRPGGLGGGWRLLFTSLLCRRLFSWRRRHHVAHPPLLFLFFGTRTSPLSSVFLLKMKRRWAPVGMGSRSKRRVTFSRSRAEADQTSLPGRLEVLGDWEVVCVIPVSKRWNLSTSLTHIHRSWWWRIKAKEKDGLLLLLVL